MMPVNFKRHHYRNSGCTIETLQVLSIRQHRAQGVEPQNSMFVHSECTNSSWRTQENVHERVRDRSERCFICL
jgi:hypothetical protein